MILEYEKIMRGKIGFISEAITIDQSIIDEFKQFARIDNVSENMMLEQIILSSIQACEKYLGRALFEKKITFNVNKLDEEIELPYPPLVSVDSISVRQDDGTLEAIPSTDYYIIAERIPGSVIMKSTLASSLTAKTAIDPFVIQYTCGYGDTWASIPDAIRHSIFVWANDGYQNRVIQPEPPIEVKQLLSLYTIERL